LACVVEVLGPPPAYMLERAPRCADFAEPAPYGVQATPVGNMMLLPNGACLVGGIVIKPYTNTKGKRRRPGSRPLVQLLARANDPRLVDFVMRTLAWDPAMRLTPEDALRHPWIADMQIPRQSSMGMPMGMPVPGGYALSSHGGSSVGGGYVQQHMSQQQLQQMGQQQLQHQQMGQLQQQQQQPGFNNMARARKA
ncbi:serine/threonine protein kinase, CMGC, dual-specificity, partial [Kickxella alabastrina]